MTHRFRHHRAQRGHIDLHLQTHYSDGALSPQALVRLARAYGYTTIAITDHDTVGGIAEAVTEGKRCGVTVIPGIELYAHRRGVELHILGYAIDPVNAQLHTYLHAVHIRHRRWVAAVTTKMRQRGWAIPENAFAQLSTKLLGFRDLVNALEASPANRKRFRHDFGTLYPDLFEVITRYFGPRGAFAVPMPEKRLSARLAIQLIRRAGGKAVLAHPGQTVTHNETALLRSLRRDGLVGIEAVTPHHTWHQVVRYQKLACALGLFVTAGSDFHEVLPDARLPYRLPWDYFRPTLTVLPWKRA